MRLMLQLNEDWFFFKDHPENLKDVPIDAKTVCLPHTWNGIDGQDGGNDYFRGTCRYAKKIQRSELPAGQRCFLEINGANSSADVYLNGVHLRHHDGGYSTWRVDLTKALQDENLLEYVLRQPGAVLNWCDVTQKEGFFCLNDRFWDLTKTPGGLFWLGKLLVQVIRKLCSSQKNTSSPSGIFVFHKDITVLQYFALLDQIKVHFDKDELLHINDQLSKIKKPRH